MTHARTPASPLALAPIRHDGWTTQRQVTFLDALAASHSVSEAARAVGMSRQSAYALRARLKGEPFDLARTAAFRCRFDALAEAALDRAINGVEVQHFYNGELVGTTRRYDERLTLALLAMRGTGGARRTSASHPAAEYGPEDFGCCANGSNRARKPGTSSWMRNARRSTPNMTPPKRRAARRRRGRGR